MQERKIILPFYPLKAIYLKKSAEEIAFSSAELNIDDSGSDPFWNVHITTVELDNYLIQALKDSDEPELVFLTENDEKYGGKVMVSNRRMGESGALLELIGKGKLKNGSKLD